MITQLVYTSSATFDPASESGGRIVSEIVQTARVYNSQVGISGFLLVGADWFAQVLEGQGADVTTLFRRILFDRRHTNVRLIETRPARERLFPEWAMGYTDEPLYSAPLTPLMEPGRPGRLEFPFDRIVACALREAKRMRAAEVNG